MGLGGSAGYRFGCGLQSFLPPSLSEIDSKLQLVCVELRYVETDSSQEGTAVQQLVRGKLIPAQVSASAPPMIKA